MHAADVILAARRQAALSQAELAERAGTNQAVISRYESRKAHPSFAMVERLVEAADLQMEIELIPRVPLMGEGPIGQALTRERAVVLDTLRGSGVVEAEIAGDFATGTDTPGTPLLLLVRARQPLDDFALLSMRGTLEVCLGCTVIVLDADNIWGQWRAQADGPRMPFDLGPEE